MRFVTFGGFLLSLLCLVSAGALGGEKWELPALPAAHQQPQQQPQQQQQQQQGPYTSMYSSSYSDPTTGTVTLMERQGSQPTTITVLDRNTGMSQIQGSSSSGLITSAGGFPAAMAMLERQGTPSGSTYGQATAGNYAPGPYPPYGFKDPGFSVQTGFEGFLVSFEILLIDMLSCNCKK